MTFGTPGLCGDADPVPAQFSKVAGRKYQPNSVSGDDYDAGDGYTGWRCLRFTQDSPQYYQYQYKTGGPPVDVALPHGGTPPGLDSLHQWTVTARGDVDGDGKASWFVLQGIITQSGQIIAAPSVGTVDPEE